MPMAELSSDARSNARPSKGEQTRAAILDTALDLAARDGLEGLTIGLIAERMRMSKSGVFAHFGSREDLQLATLHEYHHRFEAEVFTPALRKPRGLPRLEAMFPEPISLLPEKLVNDAHSVQLEFQREMGSYREVNGLPALRRGAGIVGTHDTFYLRKHARCFIGIG